jgi:pyruvate kinase
MKHTKIIATIGPASDKPKVLKEVIKQGLSIARLNFSHGTYASHKAIITNVRKLSKQLQIPVLILQDLQGPKIRVKELKQPLVAKRGKKITLGKDFAIDADVMTSLKPGQRIFIQDGLIQLKVIKVDGNQAVCLVVDGGKIQSHKGVNLPDTNLKLAGLTAKDLKDLQWGLKQKVDLVAMSFVRSSADIKSLRTKFRGDKHKPKIVAKIEKPEAVKNIAAIIKASDYIMVARGDLGVEMPEEQVPLIQNRIVKLCRKAKKPVIVATQMLESMVTNPRPTRAEVSDVADAVLDGADYVMLSEETAFGQYPVEAVREMKKIITAAQK